MENLNLSVELDFNQSQLKADAEKAKAEITGVGNTAEASAKRVTESVKRISQSNQDLLDKYAKNAREAEAIYAAKQAPQKADVSSIKDLAVEVLNLKDANQENNQAQSESSSLLSGIIGLLPGLSIATVLAFAAGPILKYLSSLDLFSEKIKQSVKDKIAFNEVQLQGAQAAQKEKVELDTLYKSATNLNLPLADRNRFVDEIQSKYPSYFGNLTNEAILAGNAATAYKSLSEQIVAAAKARAAQDRIAKNQARILENEQRNIDDQAINIKNAALAKANDEFLKKAGNSASSGTATGTGSFNNGFLENARKKEREIIDKRITDRARDTQILSNQNEKLANAIQGGIEKNGAITILGEPATPKTPKVPAAPKAPKTPKEAKDNYDGILKGREDLNDKLLAYDAEYTGNVLSNEDKEIARIKALFVKIRKAVEDENVKLQAYNDDPKNKKKVALLPAGDADRIEKNAIDAVEKKRFDNLLKANETYKQKALKLEQDYEKDKADLLAKGKTEEAGVLFETYQSQLSNLNEVHIKKLDSYKNLYKGIELLSNAEAQKVIDSAKELLNRADFPKELYAEFKALIEKAEVSLTNRAYDALGKIGDAFVGMANGVKDLDEGLANLIGTLGNVLKAAETVGKSIGGIKKGIADYSKTKADAGGGFLGSIAGIAGVAGPVGAAVGAVTSLVSGIVNIFKAAKESSDKAKKEIADYYATAKAGELDYNRTLRERARTQQSITDATLSELDARKQLLNTQGSQAQQDYDNALRDIQANGKQITGERTEKYGGFLGIGRKTRVVQDTAGINGLTYDQLEKLSAGGKLDAATQKLYENLKKSRDELDAIGASAEETAAALNKVITGTTAQSITDGIIQGFKNGDDAATSFANNFKDLMDNAAISIFESTYLKGAIAGFYENFAAAGKDGIYTDAEKEALKAEYLAIGEESKKRLDNLTDITGTKKSSNNLQGAFKSASQDSINILAGYTAGARLAALAGNVIAKDNAQSQLVEMRAAQLTRLQIQANTLRTADNTDSLQDIKIGIAVIAKATSDTYNYALRASGQKGI
ncbi:hypothetical protein ACVWYG_002592 [Pedobacter sp. UYEF25]